jgi:hypothetical protein
MPENRPAPLFRRGMSMGTNHFSEIAHNLRARSQGAFLFFPFPTQFMALLMSLNTQTKVGFVLLMVLIALLAGTTAAIALFALILKLGHLV